MPPDSHFLTCWPGHQRSALLCRVVFADNLSRGVYRDIDLKGIGHVAAYSQNDLTTAIETINPIKKRPEGGYYGLLDLSNAFSDQLFSEELANAGIRTHRILAILKLEELIVEGRKISLEEARTGQIISEDCHPVIAVRAYGTKARIKDISLRSGKTEQYRRLMVEDAKKIIGQEFNLELTSDKDYLEWFAKSLGTNFKLVHNRLGKTINGLTEHNITLDCCFTDYDGVASLQDAGVEYDLERVEVTLRNLTKYLGLAFSSVYEELIDFEKFDRAEDFWISKDVIEIFRQNYSS